MSHYKHHVFFCLNQREQGAECCAAVGAAALFDYARSRAVELNIRGAGGVRMNRAGCLDRCDFGPCMVVYPEAVWYQMVDESDVEEIIQEHLINGRPVERLRIPDEASGEASGSDPAL